MTREAAIKEFMRLRHGLIDVLLSYRGIEELHAYNLRLQQLLELIGHSESELPLLSAGSAGR
jgi:hypothetical protein